MNIAKEVAEMLFWLIFGIAFFMLLLPLTEILADENISKLLILTVLVLAIRKRIINKSGNIFGKKKRKVNIIHQNNPYVKKYKPWFKKHRGSR